MFYIFGFVLLYFVFALPTSYAGVLSGAGGDAVKRLLVAVFAVCAMATSVYAGPEKGTYVSSGVTNTTPESDAYGTVVRPINGSPVQSLTIASAVTTNTSTAPFPYLFVTTTATTGTGASGTERIGY